jgi:hypothetical protein
LREEYLDDAGLAALQQVLMANMEAGDVIENSGGLRKLRFPDPRRQKGRRGGLRVIYFWWVDNERCLLFAIYRTGEVDDLTPSSSRCSARHSRAN